MLQEVPKMKKEDIPGSLKTMYDYVTKLKQELEYQLLNLDSDNIRQINADVVRVDNLIVGENVQMGDNAYISWDNVQNPPDFAFPDQIPTPEEIQNGALDIIKSTYIDANGVWTPQVYANRINTLFGKILVAQIEDLTVGSNVTMGPNAVIQWGNLPPDVAATSDVPTIPSYIQSTKITRTSIESPSITGGSIYQASDGNYHDCQLIGGRLQFFKNGYNTGVILSDHVSNTNLGGAVNKLYIEGTDALKLGSVYGNMSLSVPTGKKIYIEGHLVIDTSKGGKITDQNGNEIAGGAAILG